MKTTAQKYSAPKTWMQSALLLILLSACCGTAEAIDLDEVLAMAFKNDALHKSRLYEASADRALGQQALFGYGPHISASASYQLGRKDSVPDKEPEDSATTATVPDEREADFQQAELIFSLTQPVVDFEKFFLAQQGSADISTSELKRKQAVEDLILLIHEKYFALLIAEENLALAKEECTTLKQQLDDAEQRLDLGYGIITDKENAQAKYALSLAEKTARQIERDSARIALEEAVGIDFLERIDDIPGDMKLPEFSKDLSYWQKTALKKNSGYNIALLQLKSARKRLHSRRSRFVPALNLFGSYNHTDTDMTLDGYGETNRETIAGLRLEMDLFASGRDTFDVIAASRQKKAAKKRVEAEKRHVLSTVENIWDSLRNTLALISSYKTAVEAAKVSMKSTETGYLEGMYSLLDLLNVQQEYYRTMSQYKSARYNYLHHRQNVPAATQNSPGSS
ncbi:MAG: hypothetical protein CSA11_12385 [Chloroflexi bacterium]|nr:MAG: hypothetical protein CSA11_12385 [Chloroflexota bacterium]